MTNAMEDQLLQPVGEVARKLSFAFANVGTMDVEITIYSFIIIITFVILFD